MKEAERQLEQWQEFEKSWETSLCCSRACGTWGNWDSSGNGRGRELYNRKNGLIWMKHWESFYVMGQHEDKMSGYLLLNTASCHPLLSASTIPYSASPLLYLLSGVSVEVSVFLTWLAVWAKTVFVSTVLAGKTTVLLLEGGHDVTDVIFLHHCIPPNVAIAQSISPFLLSSGSQSPAVLVYHSPHRGVNTHPGGKISELRLPLRKQSLDHRQEHINCWYLSGKGIHWRSWDIRHWFYRDRGP